MLEYDDVTWEKDKRGDKIIIGRGTFGTVYAGTLHDQPVAIKAETLGEGDEEAWMKAARLHMRAIGPYIVKMIGIIVDRVGGRVTHYAVMERLAGTLTDLLLTRSGPHYNADLELRLALLADVAGGLAYLHAASVIHADMKPDNVLLTAPSRRMPLPVAKLADFGSSVQRRAGTRTRGTLVGERGTLVYMDPCLLDRSASITAASDVYSFGIMAWQVLTGCMPYAAEIADAAPASEGEAVLLLRAHVCGSRGKRPTVAVLVERGVPPAVVALIESCWAPAQASRPVMEAVHRGLEAAAVAAGAPSGNGSDGGCGPVPAPVPLPAAVPIIAPAPALASMALSTPASVVPVAPGPLAYEWDDQLFLRGHTDRVRSLALLPGGQLASGDEDGTVRVWDVARGGEATVVLEDLVGEVTALVAMPGTRRLAAGVSDPWPKTTGVIVVWDTNVTPPIRRATIDCGSGVCGLAVLRDDRLVAGCEDGGVRLVEVGADAGVVKSTLQGHTDVVRAGAVLPDDTLASGSYDTTVRLWDVGTRACVATLAGHTKYVFALVVLADGRLASGSLDKSVRLWDVATRACVGVLEGHTGCVNALAAVSVGRLVSGSDDKTIRVWDTRPTDTTSAGTAGMAAVGGVGPARATPVVVLEGHTNDVNTLLALPGGRLASGSRDNRVRLWSLPSP